VTTVAEMTDDVRVSRPAWGVLLVELDRPGQRNALSSESLAALDGALRGADVRAAVIAGRGTAFCAGYDLGEAARPAAAEALVAHPAHPVFEAIESAGFPVIAAVHGPTFGGGLELAACCDVRVAAADVSFAVPAGRLGLTYSAPGLERIGRVFGYPAVREMVLADRRLDAARAAALGAVAEIVADAEAALQRALQIARRITGLAPGSARANKRLLRELAIRSTATMSTELITELAALRRQAFDCQGEFRRRVEAFRAGTIVRWSDDEHPPGSEQT
jgi:enoyl-CoA hydratase/carnithine racemase